MHRHVRIFLKILHSLFLALFSVPLIGYGCYLCWCWIRIHLTPAYYGSYEYATIGLILFGLGSLNLWACLYGVWRRSFHGLLFAAPVLIGLASAVHIPCITPRWSSYITDSTYLSHLDRSLCGWHQDNRRFPANESEFREALEKGARHYSDSHTPLSNYNQGGQPLPYEIIVVNNAGGPRVNDVTKRPGVIYYCVSSDLQEFWVTMTSLRSIVAPAAYLRYLADSPERGLSLVHGAGAASPALHR
ncbi:MAG: hypothetical protein WCA91_24475 [Candidatus Acidiferrales bacterium]